MFFMLQRIKKFKVQFIAISVLKKLLSASVFLGEKLFYFIEFYCECIRRLFSFAAAKLSLFVH